MSKVPVHLLPASVQLLVERLVDAGFSLVNATTGNGRRNLGDNSELTGAEAAEAFQRDLATRAHGFGADVLDITSVKLTRRQSFEDVTITFTPEGLKAAEQADSTPAVAALPSHMPATSRQGAEAVLALGYKAHGHLTFTKGDHSTRMPEGVKVQFSWIS